MNVRHFALLIVVLLLVVAQTAISAERLKPDPIVPGRPAVLQKTPETPRNPLKKEAVDSTKNIPQVVTTKPLKLTGVAQDGLVSAPNIPQVVTTKPLKLTGFGQ